jgi:arylsulfatase A-like enzyme
MSAPEKKDFKLSQYDGEVAYLDHHLGLLFSHLKKNNLYDSSLIIVTSDHGDLFDEHGLSGHESYLYEGTIRVPLIIKYPFSREIGRKKTFVSLVDLYSEILSNCGLPIPAVAAGRLFDDEPETAVSEFYDFESGIHRAIYKDDYKYLRFERNKAPELYNLKKDPFELENLAKLLPEITFKMEESLETWAQTHQPKNIVVEDDYELSQDIIDGLKSLGYIE